MDHAVSLEKSLSLEVLRKFRLATEAETKDDREIICEEIFCDVTGVLDEEAQERLHVHRPAFFYEVLAEQFDKDGEAADTLLSLCKQLWGQPYVAPIYALLLHQWLLLHPEAGGAEQRQKHVNVLMLGARQLFQGDVQSSVTKFANLFTFFSEKVVFVRNTWALDRLPAEARTRLLSVVAAYLPYYCESGGLLEQLASFPPPSFAGDEGPQAKGEAMDFVVTQVTDTISLIRTEAGLVRYLQALATLDGSSLKSVHTITSLRLQSELYSLTSPGGPHYAPPRVQSAAMHVLDRLFPMGRRTRKMVHLLFRLVHPQDYLGPLISWGTSAYSYALKVMWGVASWTCSLLGHRR